MGAVDDFLQHIGHAAGAFQNADRLAVFKADGELVEGAHPPADGDNGVGRFGQQKIPAGIVKTGVNNKVVIIKRKMVGLHVGGFGNGWRKADDGAAGLLRSLGRPMGMPVVAPVTRTKPRRAISRPTSCAASKAPEEQCPVSAAPETQILYFGWYNPGLAFKRFPFLTLFFSPAFFCFIVLDCKTAFYL